MMVPNTKHIELTGPACENGGILYVVYVVSDIIEGVSTEGVSEH